MAPARRKAAAPVSRVPAPRPSAEWERRKAAAAKYRPPTVKLLLVADAPARESYFYFEDAPPDPLFEDLAQVLFEAPPVPGDRGPYLRELRRRGIFLVELKPDAPRDAGESLAPYADWLPTRVDVLGPERILLIGGDVHDAAHDKLERSGLPVEASRIAWRAGGDRREARGQLRAALVRAGLETLIRGLPPGARAALGLGPGPKRRARSVKPRAESSGVGLALVENGAARETPAPERGPKRSRAREADAAPPSATRARGQRRRTSARGPATAEAGAPAPPQRSRPPGRRTPTSSR